MGEFLGIAIGTVFVGGILGWIIHKITAQPFATADAIGLILLVALSGLGRTSGGPTWGSYALAALPAYFILKRLRAQAAKANTNVVPTEPAFQPLFLQDADTHKSEQAAHIAIEEDIVEAVRAQYSERAKPSRMMGDRQPKRNFVARHWHGELSLPVAYWVVNSP